MGTEENNVRVSFKLSREAAIKLREIALSRGEVLCSLGVLAVQLGNESQICISSPLRFNFPGCAPRRSAEEGFDSELTDSVGDLSDHEKLSEDEAVVKLDGGVRDVDRDVALATAASVKLCHDTDANNTTLLARTPRSGNARNALYREIQSKKSREKTGKLGKLERKTIVTPGVKKVSARDMTAGSDSPNVNKEGINMKYDGQAGVSFAQQLINLSKQYRLENEKSPTSERYFDAARVVRSDHVLRSFNHDKPDDFMGLSVNNALFDNYGATAVKSAEELSKEQSEMSPTNLDSMSVSSADSLFEEARLGSVDELRLSPSSVHLSVHDSSNSTSPSPSGSMHSEYSPSQEEKSKKSAKIQKLVKSHTGVVCELCMKPVQKSYSCYQMNHAPKEIMHLFDNGSRCVRVCRRCLPYKSPKRHDKNGHKKTKKILEQLST